MHEEDLKQDQNNIIGKEDIKRECIITTPKILVKNNKHIYKDFYFSNVNKSKCISDMLLLEKSEQELFKNAVYFRVNASKNIKLINFNFSHSFFDDCVLRKIIFENCNFTDCKFRNCDFKGANFIDCNFQYAKFQSTFIHEDILKHSAPRQHNLRRNLARSLRMNFSELGLKKEEYIATQIELQAQGQFLKEAWLSGDEFYTRKYPGIKRFYKFLEWLNFQFNNFIWGHGEQVSKLIFSFLAILIFLVLLIFLENPKYNFLENMIYVLQYFIGSQNKPDYLGDTYASFIILLRIVFSGLLLTIIIKKMSR